VSLHIVSHAFLQPNNYGNCNILECPKSRHICTGMHARTRTHTQTHTRTHTHTRPWYNI